MFDSSESENRNGSCGATPTSLRSVASGRFRTSTPSIRTVPGGGSSRRVSSWSSVDLPLPVAPTTATVCPARSEGRCRRARGGRRTRGQAAELDRAPGGGSASLRCSRGSAGITLIAGGSSRISSIRFHDAMPRCSMFVTQPNAIIGQLSITRYALNATSSPTVMRPCDDVAAALPEHQQRAEAQQQRHARVERALQCESGRGCGRCTRRSRRLNRSSSDASCP